jgi:hypothetical protein
MNFTPRSAYLSILFVMTTATFLFASTVVHAQTKITTNGQTGSSGTNWSSSVSGNTLTITTTGNTQSGPINQSVINDALSSGQNVVLVTNANSIDLDPGVAISNTGSTAVRLTLKSIGYIYMADDVSISSTNSPMDIILWADWNDSQNSNTSTGDEIHIRAGVTIDSNGGQIVLAGGLDDGKNGGIANDGIPDNYAYKGNGDGLGGVNLGPSGGTGTVVSLLSQGGDITIRGWSRNSTSNARPGIVSQANLKIDAGAGRVAMQGISSVNAGIEFTYGAIPNIAITSSYSGTDPAIRIAGGAVNSGRGLYLVNNNAGNFLIQSTSTTGGGVLLQGQNGTSNNNTAISLLPSNSNTNLQILSGTGNIVLENSQVDAILGTSQGIIQNFGLIRYGARVNTTPVQGITPAVASSNANVIFRGKNIQFETGTPVTTVASTGAFSVVPLEADDSFTSGITFRNVNLETVSELIIGKVGNTQQVIVSTDISVNGPISIYGGSFENIQINANVTSTADGDILLRGENSTGWTARLNSTKTIEKTAGTGSLIVHGTGRIGMDGTILASGSAKLNVVLSAETDDGSTYGVSVKDITTNGGHVWIGGGSMVNTWNGLTVGTRWAASSNGGNNNAIDLAGNITTNGGDVLMSAWSGWLQDIAASAARTISTGTGDVTFLVRHASFGSNKITINSTGTFTLAPPSGQSFDGTKVFNGTTASGIFTGSNNANPLVINDIANLKALHIGNYFGTGTVDDTPYDYKNIRVTDMNASLDINGPIVIYGAGVWVYGSLKTAAPNNPIQLIATGGDISLQGNLTTTTAGASILAKATGDITSNASRTFQTNNGNFIIWSDSDNTNGGGISVGDNNTFNTANGSTASELTGGGRIVMAGGADTNNDGIPDGVATGSHGVLLGLNTSNTTTMYSGGGDIILRGKSTVTSGRGIYQVGKLEANAGNGAIDFFGESNVFFGIDFNAALSTNKQLILTSNKASGTAISITGTSGGNYGVVFNNNAPKEVLATGGGNIDIVGTAAIANTGVFLQDVDILATAGTITINGGVRGTSFTDRGARLGSRAGSAIPSSSANIRLISDVNTFNALSTGYTNNFNTSGTVTIEPFSNSFTSALTFPITNLTVANTISGFTLGKSTNTSNITFGAATSIAGPITVFGGNIAVNENLNTTTGTASGDILLKSSGDISLAASKSITTAGGDVILWANIDNEAANGSIALRNGSSIVTGSGSVAGGHVWIGGGSDGTTWNGLSVGSGYAVPGTTFTPSNGGGTLQSGVYLERNSISSFGGNIKIAGDGAATARGIVTYGNTVAINAGSGKVEIDGQVTSTATGNRGGVLFGLHDSQIASTVNISSSATTGDAITINGVGRGAEDAIGLSGTLNITSSGGGNIVMNGNALGSGRSIVAGNYFHGILNVFANSGTITLNGNTKAVQVDAAVFNGLTSGPSKINIGQGGAITSSSSDVFITADNVALAAGGIAINSTGKVTVESSSDSFASALTYPITNLTVASTISGLTLGKATNTANITMDAATTVAGPITVYGGTIDVDANLTSTATSGTGISLNGQNIAQNVGIGVTTSGANIDYLASGFSTTSGVDNAIKIGNTVGTRASINAGGGNVSLTGSFGTTSTSGSTDYGIWLFSTDVITSGTGSITLTGDATNTLSTSSSYGISMGNATVKTQSGAITLNGTGGKASGNSRGIVADAFSNKIVSVSGPITLNEIKPTGLTGTYTGLYMKPGTSVNTFIGADGTDVASSSSSVTITGDLASFDVNSTFRNNINTSGAIVFESVANSFETAPSLTGLTISGNPSSVRIGKTTNTANITVGSAVTAEGPIEVYAGTIAVNAALTATNSNINLTASTAVTQDCCHHC